MHCCGMCTVVLMSKWFATPFGSCWVQNRLLPPLMLLITKNFNEFLLMVRMRVNYYLNGEGFLLTFHQAETLHLALILKHNIQTTTLEQRHHLLLWLDSLQDESEVEDQVIIKPSSTWEAWRIAMVGAAGEKGLYDLVVPGEQADVKVDSKDNRNLWFLLARATGSLAVGVVREFEGHLGMPDGKGAVGYTTTPLIVIVSVCEYVHI